MRVGVRTVCEDGTRGWRHVNVGYALARNP